MKKTVYVENAKVAVGNAFTYGGKPHVVVSIEGTKPGMLGGRTGRIMIEAA